MIMKIAIPTMDLEGMDAIVGQHFGSSPAYTLYDTESGTVQSVPNASRHMGGQGYPPEILHGLGVNVLVCKGLGIKALDMFSSMGIEVLIGAGETVRDTIALWKEGKLCQASRNSACQGHSH
jgi:predicted Fe-Mo cluster-binding NifX family protein